MVNRGEEKVRVHMNVVPRNPMNTMVEQREEVGDDLGGESRRRESKGTYECCAA